MSAAIPTPTVTPTPTAGPTPTPTPTAGRSTWHLDPAHLEFGFAVRHLMISTVRGRFAGVTGVVSVDRDDFATASVDVTIDAATVDTREPKRDAHLRSADFFDVGRFPTLTFRSRRVGVVTPGRYTLAGDLTIHGVTREVALDVTAEGLGRDPWGNDRAGFSARGVIKRSDFGLTWNQVLEAGGIAVGDEVKLAIDAELIRQAATVAA